MYAVDCNAAYATRKEVGRVMDNIKRRYIIEYYNTCKDKQIGGRNVIIIRGYSEDYARETLERSCDMYNENFGVRIRRITEENKQ